ncbi:MAG: DNA mismatch repair endonuclease MutL [Thermodesulfovibrionales bacterium]|nr:DNA mismatch repair endonuclease MutL [Thermodesulfovibrionales bacterium]
MPETENIIRLLPDDLINKIQAGEVIERPASVLKELIENSIDAGSRRITVEVSGAGRRLIRVSDDGFGMDKEDALLSLKRHATSKLLTEADLFNIRTMGFRGEALPSIASVSMLALTTAAKGRAAGVRIEAEAGNVKEIKDAPSLGTMVEVKNLFYNTPARLKFLKRDSTELLHIIETATRLALSHPEVGLTLKSDGHETLDLAPASGLRERLMQVYGAEFLEGLMEIESSSGGLSFTAFVSKRENLREGRSHQMIFINKRPVRERSLSHAVYSAYEGLLHERHPVYFLFIEMDPKNVDFNVHPQKLEVRFKEKEAVYRFLREAVREELRGQFPETAHSSEMPGAEMPAVSEPRASFGSSRATLPDAPRAGGEPPFEPLLLSYKTDLPFVYLGETFIALSERGGLTIIDHHAAHERVLYERLLKGIKLQSSHLLFPRQVRLSPKEYAVILGQKEMLEEFGVQAEDFGHDTVLVRALPEALDEADIRGILSDVAGVMLEGEMPIQSLKEAVASRMACHSSVRGRRILNSQELGALLNDLNETEVPDACPHGRPTRVFYSLDELKRIFKRK